LNRRAPHIQIFISPCRVQGDSSSESIKVAFKRVESLQQTENFDAVIVSRGGGSIEDLWSFNNEELCRHISESKLPVVSGIGHETDFTLLDFVSNIRAETPTAAAEIVSEGASKIKDYLEFMKESLHKKIFNVISNLKEKINFLKKLLRSPKQKIQDQYLKLDHKSQQLNLTFNKFIQRKKDNVEKEKLKLIFNSPKSVKDKGQAKLKDINKVLYKQLTSLINALNLKINNFEQQLISLSPKEILNRGYSITYGEKGEIIKSAKKLSGGEKLITQLSDGKIQSKVE